MPAISTASTGNPDEARNRASKGSLVPTAQNGMPREFADLDLLIRVLKERQMETLFISQPLNLADDGLKGIDAQNRQAYYKRLRELLDNPKFRLRDFSDHESDPSFFGDVMHPSAKAWLLYDREIDRFYSGATDGP